MVFVFVIIILIAFIAMFVVNDIIMEIIFIVIVVSVVVNRDFKIDYGEVLLRLREIKFTSGDVSTCAAVRLSSRSMLFHYGKVLRLA